MATIKQLVDKLKEANKAYRKGNSIMSDSEYDRISDELLKLDAGNEFFKKIGHVVTDGRKSKLPITMASMSKVKSLEELKKWAELKKIPMSTEIICMPKLDGLSLCENEITEEGWTRGDGIEGQKSDEHIKLISNKLKKHVVDDMKRTGMSGFTNGEVIMSKNRFKKYADDFANPRNLVAGLMNRPVKSLHEVEDILKDCVYIRYGIDFDTDANRSLEQKSQLLDSLNDGQDVKINYVIKKLSELTEPFLISLFNKWSEFFEIDGIIVEVNDLALQQKLGRETSSNNPVYARAFKSPTFEQSAVTEVIGITWNISKQGLLKPILHIKPVKLDGVTISNVTGNNARFVKDMGLGIGAVVKVKRSGMVIPIINEVIKSVPFVMPNLVKTSNLFGMPIGWNDNGVELITLTETEEQKFQQVVAFFNLLESDNVSEGVLKQLWEAGYTTLKVILHLMPADLEKIPGFGQRKASIVYNSIQECIRDIELHKLQHATGIFKMLGSKKLALLTHFKTKPSLSEVMAIEGFAETSAQAYIDGYDKFNEFIKGLPITIKQPAKPTGSKLIGKSFVFTGVRRGDLEKIIVDNGGKIGSSISKETTFLISKELGSGSSKEEKALSLNVPVVPVSKLEEYLENELK